MCYAHFCKSFKSGKMANFILPWLLGLFICLNCSGFTEAASNGTDLGIISFPAEANACQCSISLSCSCCQSVVVDTMNMTKTLCLTFKVSILSVTVDVGVTLDGTSVAQFSINAKTPPTFCLPVLSLTPLNMCLKLNASIVGLSGLKLCPTFYSTLNSSQVVAYDFPCVKLTTDGVSMA